MEARRRWHQRSLNPLSRKMRHRLYSEKTMADQAPFQSSDPGFDSSPGSVEDWSSGQRASPESRDFADPGPPPSPVVSWHLPIGPELGRSSPRAQEDQGYSIETAQQWLSGRGLSRSPGSRHNGETLLPNEPQQEPVGAAVLRSP